MTSRKTSSEKLAKPRPQEKNRLKPGKEELWGVKEETDKTVLGRRNSKSRDDGGM